MINHVIRSFFTVQLYDLSYTHLNVKIYSEARMTVFINLFKAFTILANFTKITLFQTTLFLLSFLSTVPL